MDWDTFEIEAAVVHYVPTEDEDDSGTALLLTDEEIPLDAPLKAYFRDKIAERLEAKGLEVVVDVDQAQTVPEAIASVVAAPDELVAGSQEIATHLDEVQTRVNSPGLVAIVRGRIEGTPCVAVLKLERERGVHFEITTTDDGRYVVDLELLRTLTLTDKTKVYKTALLLLPAGGDATDVYGYVADDQRTRAGGRFVAGFFLSRFLGCMPKVPAARITYEFLKAANVAINEDVTSPERKGRYQVALLAVMQDNTAEVRPQTFAERHLEPRDRPAFLARVEEAGIDPKKTFAKDTSLVKVSQFKMTFKSGMVLVGSKQALEEHVELPEEDKCAAQEPVVLKDSIERLLTGT